MKSKLLLRELGPDDESAFLRGLEDWKNEDLVWYSFAWKPGMSHQDHLQLLIEQKSRTNLGEGRVPSTMLYAFVDGEIVGRINIRHELNSSLLVRGGNIGYSVSPRHRKKGYATEIFRQGLRYCKSLGLKRVLITCADHNVASWKVIEHCGGSLENRIIDGSSKDFVRRYWIETEMENFDPQAVSRKVVAYITRRKNSETQILVFDHDPEFHDAGTQVPSGSVESGELPETAVIRETREESGLTEFNSIMLLDEYQLYGEHSKKYLRRYVYHLVPVAEVPDQWTYNVKGSGDDKGMRFHYYWIDLKSAKGRLSARFDDSIDLLLQTESVK